MLRHFPPHATPFCNQGLTTSNSGSPGLPEIIVGAIDTCMKNRLKIVING